MMWDYPGWGGGFGWIGMIAMMFFGLLVLAGFVLLVWWLVSVSARAGRPGGMQVYGGRDEALETARRRYAAGEITQEQYEEIVQTLRR